MESNRFFINIGECNKNELNEENSLKFDITKIHEHLVGDPALTLSWVEWINNKTYCGNIEYKITGVSPS